MLEEDGWMRDALFFFIACAVHGALLSANPSLPWAGPGAKALEPAVEVDFVAALPRPSTPELASVQAKPSPQETLQNPEAEKPKALPATRRPSRGLRRHRRDRMSRRPRADGYWRRAAAARRRIDIRQQLAALPGPDEELSEAPNDPGLAAARLAESAPADPVYEERSERRGGAEPPSEFGSEGLSWSIEGPAGNRRLLAKALPASPEWLARRGLELCVAIKFQVLADGAVRPGAVIQKTSGFPEIDRLAMDALRRWRFEPAGGTGAAGIWGKVTFRFLMG